MKKVNSDQFSHQVLPPSTIRINNAKTQKESPSQIQSRVHLSKAELNLASIAQQESKQKEKFDNIVTARTYQQLLKETSIFLRGSGLQGQKLSAEKEKLKKLVGYPQAQKMINENINKKQSAQVQSSQISVEKPLSVQQECQTTLLNNFQQLSFQQSQESSKIQQISPHTDSKKQWRQGILIFEEQNSPAKAFPLSNDLKKMYSLDNLRIFLDQQSPLKAFINQGTNRHDQLTEKDSFQKYHRIHWKKVEDKPLKQLIKTSLQSKSFKIQDNQYSNQMVKQEQSPDNFFKDDSCQTTPIKYGLPINMNGGNDTFTRNSITPKQTIRKSINLEIEQQRLSNSMIRTTRQKNKDKNELESTCQFRIHSKLREESHELEPKEYYIPPILQKEQYPILQMNSSSVCSPSSFIVNQALILTRTPTTSKLYRSTKVKERPKLLQRVSGNNFSQISNEKESNKSEADQIQAQISSLNSSKSFKSFQSIECFSKMVEKSLSNFISSRVDSPTKKSLKGVSSHLRLQETLSSKIWRMHDNEQKLIPQSLAKGNLMESYPNKK